MNIQLAKVLFDASDSTLKQPIYDLLLGVGDIDGDDRSVYFSIRLLAQFGRAVPNLVLVYHNA